MIRLPVRAAPAFWSPLEPSGTFWNTPEVQTRRAGATLDQGQPVVPQSSPETHTALRATPAHGEQA